MTVTSKQAVREPNFFLVGASRAGTSSLWMHLVEHPDVFMPRRAMAEKEPSFFCEMTPRWALAYRDRQRYLGLFADADGQKAVGEASTPYLVAPEVPGRIRETYPDAKIIIMLRNPADRAFSLYRYLCLIGGEWVSPFEKALRVEHDRMKDESFKLHNLLWYHLYLYYHSGLYSAQVERYLTTFPREQIHIVLFDDLQADLTGTAQGVYRFLGVDPEFKPRVAKYNESRLPFSVKLQYWLGRNIDRSAEGHIGPMRARLFMTNVKLGRYLPRPFHVNTRRRLLEAYRDDIRRTAALIERPLDGWLESNGSYA
jgi:hypothetical protein